MLGVSIVTADDWIIRRFADGDGIISMFNYAKRLTAVPIAVLGQAIVLVATPPANSQLDSAAVLAKCRERLPAFMVPARIVERKGSLPRNPNGKIDRKLLAQEFAGLFEAAA